MGPYSHFFCHTETESATRTKPELEETAEVWLQLPSELCIVHAINSCTIHDIIDLMSSNVIDRDVCQPLKVHTIIQICLIW